jgi:hypothetical protein
MKHTSPYLSPEQLGISTAEHAALHRVATRLSTGEIADDDFNIMDWNHCISGHVNRLGVKASDSGPAYFQLYCNPAVAHHPRSESVAQAIFSFLSTGKADWGH